MGLFIEFWWSAVETRIPVLNRMDTITERATVQHALGDVKLTAIVDMASAKPFRVSRRVKKRHQTWRITPQ